MRFPAEIILLHPSAQLPVRATDLSCGWDLHLAGDSPVRIEPHGVVTKLRLGFACQPVANGYIAMLVLPRSGLALKHNIDLANSVGLIDPDYSDELSVLVRNHGEGPYIVQPGDRIAQAIWVEVHHPLWQVVTEFSNLPTNRKGGFGHTGVNTPVTQAASIFSTATCTFETQ